MGYNRERTSTDMEISIIIVAYNSEETICGCINSVLGTVKKNSFEIIISDNSPNELTQKVVEKEYGHEKRVKYIKNKENYGFSKGNNIAIRHAKGKYVLFLNPDTKVYDQTIDGMIEFLKKTPDCGAATCFIELPNGELDDSSHRGFPTPWNSLSHFSGLSKILKKSKLFGGYNMTYLDVSHTHEIDALAGSFMIMPFTVGERLNWWDEDYFFYGEDLDFCYRIKQMGLKIYFVADYKALHMKGISSGIKKVSQHTSKASIETKRFATHHRFRAMEIFYKKHYQKIYPKAVNVLVQLGINAKRSMTLRSLSK